MPSQNYFKKQLGAPFGQRGNSFFLLTEGRGLSTGKGPAVAVRPRQFLRVLLLVGAFVIVIVAAEILRLAWLMHRPVHIRDGFEEPNLSRRFQKFTHVFLAAHSDPAPGWLRSGYFRVQRDPSTPASYDHIHGMATYRQGDRELGRMKQ